MASMSPVPVSTPAPDTANSALLKRKRSPSVSNSTPTATQQPAAKAIKTASTNQLSINYLARQSQEDLPLINKDSPLPTLLHLLSQYSNILDRHESLASNLGARPLGPILIKRFERCFDAPPKVIASHHKGASANAADETPHGHITWLEVIEFARSHPAQFTLATFSEGRRVCQFYYPQKQLRVQVSEEDYLFINSGRCQELIPPLPIWEDEEKEVGTCDVLEAKLKELTNVADMVAARTRQLGHRLKGRRAAILERRAEGGIGTPAKVNALQTTTAPSNSGVSSAFTAVNGVSNGDSGQGAELVSSATVRNDLLRHFESLPHNQGQGRSIQPRHSVVASSDLSGFTTADRANGLAGLCSNHDHTNHDHTNTAASSTSSLSPVPPDVFINKPSYFPEPGQPSMATPSSAHAANTSYTFSHQPIKHNFSRPLPAALESSQPFRPLCQAHMDALSRGSRVLPPCDRCRRLRMDCVKNLTSCAGCTKKHARCHWREVTREELAQLEAHLDGASVAAENDDYIPGTSSYGYGGDANGYNDYAESEDDDSNPLEDLEALGEQEEQERVDAEGMKGAKELAREAVMNAQAELPVTERQGIDAGEWDEQAAASAAEGGVIDVDDPPATADAEPNGLPSFVPAAVPPAEVAQADAVGLMATVAQMEAKGTPVADGPVHVSIESTPAAGHETANPLLIETVDDSRKHDLEPIGASAMAGFGGGFKAVNAGS